MYSASKHAVKGFTDALRIELEEQGAPISLTLIKPAAIDTPFPEHAGNYTGRKAELPPPIYAPEEVARTILHAATHPIRDVFVGGGARAMSSLEHFVPRAMDWFGRKILARQQLGAETRRASDGSLYQAGEGGKIRGDYEGHVMASSLYTRAATHPLATGALVAAGAAAGMLLIGDRIRREIGRSRD